MGQHTAKNVVIALALIATGFFAAYLRFRPHLGNESSWTDGERHYESAVDEEIRYAVWDEPTPLSPTVNSEDSEQRPAISPDGLYLVFAAGQPGLNRDLYVSELIDGEPEPPRPLSLLNSPADEIAPAFAGDRLYFASDRAGGEGGFDLYESRYRNGAFDLPERLEGGINSAADDCDPSGVPGSRSIAFASNRERGRRTDHDLYLATPLPVPGNPDETAWRVVPIDPVNSPFDEREPALTADGVTLLFASDREDAIGGFDLYRSIRDRGTFLPAEPLAGVNTPRSERGPMPSSDGFTLLFASDLGSDLADSRFDLFRARSMELFRVPGKPIGWVDLLILLGLLLVALLAWLAKRWESLDILYKCFLVALILHLLLLWYFQRVVVEGDEVNLPGRDALFKVSIAHARSDASANQEFGGQLESQRTAVEAATPDRHTTRVEASAPSAAPARALSRSSRPADSSPGRARAEAAPGRTESTTEVTYQDQGQAMERIAGQKSELALDTPASRAVPKRTVSSRPERAAVALMQSAATGHRDLGPARPSLERAERRDLAADLPSRDGSTGSAPAERPDRAAELAGGPSLEDTETIEVLTGDASDSQGSSADPQPSLAMSSPASRNGATPGEYRSMYQGDLDQELSSKIALDGPAAAADLPLPAADGGGDAADAPSREAWQSEPSRQESGAPGLALDDREEPATSGSAQASGAASLAGDSLALLTPTSMGPPGRSSQPGGGPSRMQFNVSPGLPTPTVSPMKELARMEAPEPVAMTPKKLEHTPYKNRFGPEKERAIELHGGSEETERAVAMGLEYLAGRQNEMGFWGSRDDYEDKYGYVCIGKSALCLLAFLGAGHTPESNTRYSEVTEKAIGFLLDIQDDDTGHFGWTSAYSHAIATYALAECYAITRDDSMRRPIERGVAEIVRRQYRGRDPRRAGGWGYFNPEGNHFDNWPRVSVTAWQLMALESARLGGLSVEDAVFSRAAGFVKNAFDERYGYFRYNHDPSRLNSNYSTLPASTPAALFVLSFLGEEITSNEYRRPREYVLDRRPVEYRKRSEREFVLNARGNLYFWYYGSLAMFRVGGRSWEQWNEAMKETLLPSQARDGSWRPISYYADRAQDTNRDRCYTTAMCVLSLEVYYRYFTPLLKVK